MDMLVVNLLLVLALIAYVLKTYTWGENEQEEERAEFLHLNDAIGHKPALFGDGDEMSAIESFILRDQSTIMNPRRIGMNLDFS